MINVATIARVLSSETEGPELVGGTAALERVVASVGIVSSTAAAGQQLPNALVIVLPEVARLGDVNLEIVLRQAAACRVSGLVVEGRNSRVPLSAVRLAERLGIALWGHRSLDAETLRSRIDDLVRNPDLVGADTIRAVATAMRRPATELGELVTRMSRHLDTGLGLFGPDGQVIAGEQIIPPALLAEQIARRSEAMVDFSFDTPDGQQFLAVPAFPLVADEPRFWLGAIASRAVEPHTGHVAVALRIGAIAFSAHLNQAALSYERSHRGARVMLTDLQQQAAHPSAQLIEQATGYGWQLFGWHVSVQVRSDSSGAEVPEPAIAYFIAEALRRQGVRMRPVVGGRLAEFWETWSSPPREAELAELAARVERALREVERSCAGIRLRAGIGTPRESPIGIGVSLAEARSALAFAEGEQGSALVRRADQMTAHRLIEHWIPESATREAVLESIEPLRRAENGDTLMLTLRTYLDLESNTAATATALRVHRNTVLQRLQRIRELLPVDLDDPSSRLTVRLALRLHPA